MLFGVSNFDRNQLVFTSLLVMDSHQGQRHISTTPGGGLLPFLHLVRDLVQSSHQGFQVVLKRRPGQSDEPIRETTSFRLDARVLLIRRLEL